MKIKLNIIPIFFILVLLLGCQTMQEGKVAADLPSPAASKARPALPPCTEELITTALLPSGEPALYVLRYKNLSPKFVLIFFPGGAGIADPRMENGRIV